MKRISNLTISIFYLICRNVYDFVVSLLGVPRKARCIALYYHSIPKGTENLFSRQMDILLTTSRPIPGDYFGPFSAGIHYSMVTFDDGYRSFIQKAFPELQKREIPSTIFVVTGQLGLKPGWIDSHELDKDEVLMSAEELVSLPEHLITIGSHTVSHRPLTQLNSEQAYLEIEKSIVDLQSILGRRITLLAFPHGDYDQTVLDICKKAGLERVFTIEARPVSVSNRQFKTGRFKVELTEWPIEFRLKVLGAYCWRPYMTSLKQKKIPMFSGNWC